ncbi:Kelch-like protein diablo-like [Oopsacas minuta]|uniref:Kelch-like protein diablo-like n=1 Tax=Oopsacas minuta TaxID=111878 RepID=A0AAV7JW30_9METZ|nr:Kelch-like protein diablo-like [Oopsacas minuta]
MQSRKNSTISTENEYNDNLHAGHILSGLSSFYSNSNYTDVTIRTQGVEFSAHRVVLAASSPYFHTMFTSTIGEPNSDFIDLQCTSPNTFKEILEFIYTGHIEVNGTNIEEILEASCLLQIVSIQNACEMYLKSEIDSVNCIGIRYIAERFSCIELLSHANDFIVDNFCEVMEQTEFLEIPYFELISLIKQETLKVKDEIEVLDCCLKWYCHKKEERLTFMKAIFCYVKLPLIPLENVKQSLKNFPEILDVCSSMFEELQLFHSNPEQFISRNSFQFIPRFSTCVHSTLYLVGGEMNPGRTTVNTVQKYDLFRRTWEQCVPMHVARRGAGVVLVQGRLFVFGGSDGYEALSTCECYDTVKNQWNMITSMSEARSSVGTSAIGNNIYAVGGYDGISACLLTVEAYNLDTQEWEYCESMDSRRSMMAVSVLNGSLYAIGGYDGIEDLGSCEVYCPTARVWHSISPMQHKRSMAGAVCVENRLYVAGGCEQAETLNIVEIYNPDADQWYITKPMLCPRSGFGFSLLGENIYAVGGYNGSQCLNTMEAYDPKKGKWTLVAEMPLTRRRFGCCS